MAGLLPTLWSIGTGSAVMRRIAVPMAGGMVSSTFLTLLIIIAIYAIVKGWRLPDTVRSGMPHASARYRLPNNTNSPGNRLLGGGRGFSHF